MSGFSAPEPGSSSSIPSRDKKPIYKRTWFLIIAGLTLVGIFAPKSDSTKSDSSKKSTSTTDSTTPTTTIPEMMWNENLKSDVVATDLAMSTCKELTKVIRSQTKLIASRISATEKPYSDPYDSADYIAEIDWESTIHTDTSFGLKRSVTDPVLTSGSSTIPLESQYVGFVGDSIIACGLTQDSGTLDDSSFKLDQRLLNMKSLANNLPWYPKGFTTYDSNVAYRFLTYGKEYKCSYYGAYCWGVELIAKSGCSSLYAELTILDKSDRNVGWTNDTANNIRANEKVVLVFDSFDDGADTGRLSKVSCN